MLQSSNTVLDEKRISTGLPGLDPLLQGGYPKGHVILLSGTPGTGKTIACLQFLDAGISLNESVLYISTDQPIQQLIKEAKTMDIDVEQAMDSQQLRFIYLSNQMTDIYKSFEKELKDHSYQRIIIDSLTPFSEQPVWMVHDGQEHIPSTGVSATKMPLNSPQAQRAHIRHLINLLKQSEATTLVTSEVPEGSRDLSRDSISEFLSDGIILLNLDTTMDRRMLTIRKMRGTSHTLKTQHVVITKKGIALKS